MKNLVFLIQCLALVNSIGNSLDSSTYANIEEVITEHINLDFTVDFDASTFDGNVILTMKTVSDNVSSVFLDAVGMDIHSIDYLHVHEGCSIWTNVEFNITTPNPNIGNAVQIFLPTAQNNDSSFYLRLFYTTNENSTSINWLTPAQTAGKKLPYLFTQCEDIACRSVAPMQDTPAIKITYEAKVIVKNEFVAMMSANKTKMETLNETHNAYYFESNIKMPSYLIAIAVGDLEYRSLGRTTGVITEPVNIDACAEELSELQVMLDTAEQYLTPYIWGNYSILILPPSFPMGGMENPLLTFASPTIITGDKSQVDVATHEIVHSWTGNDVTCQNWESFWLNEGFTVFEERKISAILHDEDFSKVAAYIGNITMYNDMVDYGVESNYSSLFPQIDDALPDDSFSNIPYEKGFQLLYHMETLIGDDHMQTLLRGWIDMYKQKSATYLMFETYFQHYLAENFDQNTAAEIENKIQYQNWVTQPGLPPVTLDFTTKALNESQNLADEYISLNGTGSPQKFDDYNDFYSNLQVIFLTRLSTREDELNLAILQKIDEDLNITHTVDPNCKEWWFPIGIKQGYDDVYNEAHTFISSQGRLKYLTPIYKALLDAGQRDLAITWFEENKDFYHPSAVVQLEKLLGLDKAGQEFITLKESLKNMIQFIN